MGLPSVRLGSHGTKPPKFTPTQGRYLAFIDTYTKLHGVPPSEGDMQAYFRTAPPSVHQMVVTLERNNLIARTPGRARSIELLVPPAYMPDLETGLSSGSAERYPHLAAWVKAPGRTIELGWDPSTGTSARAFSGDSLFWSGGREPDTLDDMLAALEVAITAMPEDEG